MAKNRNIIIIEDNETFSLLVTHYLKNNLVATNIFVENSGRKAISSIKRLNPAVVILDYYLEDDLSAKDVMKVINEMSQPPHVILLSSITDEAEKQEVMRMGIGQFIPKSNESIYDLVKAIQEHITDLDSGKSEDEGSGFSRIAWMGIAGIAVMIIVALFFLFTQMD